VTEAKSLHPTPDRLVAFRLGRLPSTEGAAIHAHLEGCEPCSSLFDALHPDTLLALLQGTAATPSPTESTPGGTPAAEAETLPPDASAPRPDAGLPAELADHPRYRVLELLGSGGMGRVYKAEHRLMERLVALKVINRNIMDNPAAVERFRREVKTAARLSHPNIVTAFDAEQVQDWHFLVMEFVEGQSLDRFVQQRGRLPVAEACDYVRQAALGLQHAWERGMVHRDIKPQNLMRTPHGQIKVLDFGLARFLAEGKSGSALTQFGMVMGTPDYIAPEQAHDSRAADTRSDIYSLGCTFYYLLTGRVPFPEGSTLQKLMAQVEKAPTPLVRLRRDVPPAVVGIVERMMAKDPARRFQTPAEVARELGSVTIAAPAAPTAEYVPPESLPGRAAPPAVDLSPSHRETPPKAVEDKTIPIDVEPIDERLLVELAEDNGEERPRQPSRRRSRETLAHNLGIASLILGVLSFPIGCLCTGLGLPGSAIGFLLGGASLGITLIEEARRGRDWQTVLKTADRRIGIPIAGMALSAAAFFIAAIMLIAGGAGRHWNTASSKALSNDAIVRPETIVMRPEKESLKEIELG
jgi:serine/threonine protein kinase